MSVPQRHSSTLDDTAWRSDGLFLDKAQNVVHFSLEFFNLTQYLVLADSILIRFFLVA